MARANSVTIDIETTDKAGLGALVTKYRQEGKQLGDAIGDGFEQAERRTKQSTARMDSAMRGAISGMVRDLDKLERGAALSGDGMSAEFAMAAAEARTSLSRIVDAAEKTGQGLEGELGDALRQVGRDIDKLRTKPAEVDKAFSEMSRNTERLLRRIEIEAHDAGDEIGRSMSEAARSMRADLERVEQQARESGGRLDSEIGGALKEIQAQARKTRAELEDALKPPDTGGGFADSLTDAFSLDFGSMLGASAWAGPAAAAGAGIGALMWRGLQEEWAEDRTGALIAAQTGAARSAAEGLGDTAGEVFADNFGESIEQVGEAMTSVFQNKIIDTKAPEDAIERVTKKVLTLQTTTGEAANEISRSTRQMLLTDMAGNTTAAMDMIQHAVEKGLNTTDELFDTIEEYSTHFRGLGLEGQEAFGLIEQAMDGGARNIDQAADALKEFQIRAQDMSESTRRGFTTIGLNADVMGRKMAAGGNQAKEALRETLNQLRAMPAGIERNSAAVDLFGTKAEDLGDALFSMDLDTAAEKFGDFGGSVEEAAQKMSDGVSAWDKVGKGFSNLMNEIGEGLETGFGLGGEGLAGQLNAINQQLDLAKSKFESTGDTTWLDELREKYPQMAGAIDEFIESKEGEIDANDKANSGYTELVETMDSYIGKLQEAADLVLGMHDSQRAYQEAVDDVDAVIKEFGNTAKKTGEGLLANRDGFDRATEAGREMEEELDSLARTALKAADDMDANGASITDVNRHMSDARTRFINAATAMGISQSAARRLADQLKLIPRRVSTQVELRDSAARANLAAFKRALDNIPRTITVSTYVRGANIAPGGGGGHHFLESGGVTSGTVWGAQTGGARHGGTMINEAGPEIANLPNGTQVMTAGATRAAMEAGLVTLGGSAPSGPRREVTLRPDGSALSAWIIEQVRKAVRDEGGDVQIVLGAA